MTRQERKRFFEQLMALRDAYRAEAHLADDLTIDQLPAFATATWDMLVEDEAGGATASSTSTNAIQPD